MSTSIDWDKPIELRLRGEMWANAMRVYHVPGAHYPHLVVLPGAVATFWFNDAGHCLEQMHQDHRPWLRNIDVEEAEQRLWLAWRFDHSGLVISERAMLTEEDIEELYPKADGFRHFEIVVD